MIIRAKGNKVKTKKKDSISEGKSEKIKKNDKKKKKA
jgi:hypothetical protein